MIKKIMSTILGIILLVSVVNAFGIATYGEPVKVKPGESIDLTLSIQNMVGDQDYIVQSSIGTAEGITITLLDSSTSYNVPLGSEIPVKFRVTVPQNARIGEQFTIGASFTAVPRESEGTLSLQSAIGSKVIIEVAPISDDADKITPKIPPREIPQKTNSTMIIILAIIAVLIIGYFLARKKKN